MPVEKPLSSTHPDLAAEWHPTMNGDLTPDDVDASYADDVWWLCAQGHPFRAQLSSRARYETGCPVCAGKLVRPGVNDLATLNPELAAEWHPNANGDLTPDLVHPGYKGQVIWRVDECGHEFPRSPAARTQDRRCPVCVDTRVYPGQNDLATVHPELLADLAPGQDVDPGQVRATSTSARIRWVRPCGHVYTASPHDRHVDPTPPPCRACAPARPRKRSTIPTVAQVPHLLALWDSTANEPTLPSDVKSTENRIQYHWRCGVGHTWKRRPNTQRDYCKICAGEDLLPGFNDLATFIPALAAQWHPTRNDRRPHQFLPKSNATAWWLGPCGCEWEAKIANRSNGSGCRERHDGTRVLPG